MLFFSQGIAGPINLLAASSAVAAAAHG